MSESKLKIPSIRKALPNWKYLVMVLIGGLGLTFLVAFIPLPLPPILTKIVLAGILTMLNGAVGLGAWISVANEFVGMLPKPGKTEGSTEAEAI